MSSTNLYYRPDLPMFIWSDINLSDQARPIKGTGLIALGSLLKHAAGPAGAAVLATDLATDLVGELAANLAADLVGDQVGELGARLAADLGAKLVADLTKLGTWLGKLGTWLTKLGTDLTKLGTWLGKLGTWLTKLGTDLTKLGGELSAQLVTVLPADLGSGLVRIWGANLVGYLVGHLVDGLLHGGDRLLRLVHSLHSGRLAGLQLL